MTQWLLVLPTSALPTGIGTLAADISGLYIERLTENDDGMFVEWQEVVRRLLAQPSPAAPATDPVAPPNSAIEKRLAYLERRVDGISSVLPDFALGTTTYALAERMDNLETRLNDANHHATRKSQTATDCPPH